MTFIILIALVLIVGILSIIFGSLRTISKGELDRNKEDPEYAYWLKEHGILIKEI